MGNRRPPRETALGEHDVECVDLVQRRRLREQQQVDVAAGADGRVGAQQALQGEVVTGGSELALVLGALIGIPALPRRIDLEEVNFANVRLESATGASRVEISKAAPAGRRAHYRWAATRNRAQRGWLTVLPALSALLGSDDADRPRDAVFVDLRGGVNRHVEALAEQFLARGDEVRVLAPWDPPDRLSSVLHRAPASERSRPDYLVPLGRTIGLGANGAVSNLSPSPGRSPRCVASFAPDASTWSTFTSRSRRFSAGTPSRSPTRPWSGRSTYSTKLVPNQLGNLLGARRKLNQLEARIAVSKAAAWTGRRWFGGDYRIIPNGVDVDAPPRPQPDAEELRLIFVGRPEERKGLPVLLGLRGAGPPPSARLTVIGADRDDVSRYLTDPEVALYIDALGRVSGETLWALHEADVLCAPSLDGESFGMVLIEGFAAGTPVVASEIAGYSEVVSDGVDGILVPPADPQRLAEELQRLHLEPARRAAMGVAARESAQRYAWRHVADEVAEVYESARSVPVPNTSPRASRRAGLRLRTAGRPARRVAFPRSTPRPPVRPGSDTGSHGASGSRSPARWGSALRRSRRTGSVSTAWSRARCTRTPPG